MRGSCGDKSRGWLCQGSEEYRYAKFNGTAWSGSTGAAADIDLPIQAQKVSFL